MEYLISGGLLTLGYLFSKNNEETAYENNDNVKLNNKPSGSNLYTSNDSYKIEKLMQEKANKVYEKAKEPDSNTLMAGPPLKMFMNKVDYNQKIPIEFNSYHKFENNSLDNIRENVQLQPTSTGLSVSGGWNNEITQPKTFTSLTGEVMNEKDLKHNNMTPFFGGSIKQNVDEFSNNTLLETFSGNIDNYQKKKEIEPLFKPQTNIGNVYGMQNLDNDYDRYYVSDKRNNVSAVEQIRVGPGLNQGYTSEPSGGFQQSNAQEYALPKTTDEIRVKTNPKVSYEGRIISGQHIAKPGKVGAMQKKLPDRSHPLGPDRWFTTTGNVTGNTQRPAIVMKYVNRKTTEKKSRIGPAAPVNGTKVQTRGKVKVSNKIQYKSTGPRNAYAGEKWSAKSEGNHDYGKKNIKLKDTNRMVTETKTVVINRNQRDKRQAIRNKQQPRMTKKTNMIGNPRQSGNYGTPYSKGVVKDPNDIAKTTIKETNIHNNHSGNMNAPSKSIAYDPNDIAKTTIKETNIHNNHSGNMNAPSKSIAYDPNDIAKTTIKETNIDNNHSGNLNGPTKSVAYDPNDIAKTTIKETNIHNNRTGNVDANKKGKAFDPDDTPKITTKQTTIAENVLGQTNKQTKGHGYTIKKVKAPTTHRQTTSTDYAGGPQQQAADGYICANTEAPNTNRQFTSDNEYSGVAGPGNESKPLSYEDVYNATIKSVREEVSVGRTPGAQGDKEYVGVDKINAYTKRNGETQNDYINERGVMSTKVYNSLPTPDKCAVTQDKEDLPNQPIQERLNDYAVEQFKKNPYTQSLESYAFP
jgi:hypothetical protein